MGSEWGEVGGGGGNGWRVDGRWMRVVGGWVESGWEVDGDGGGGGSGWGWVTGWLPRVP